MQQQLILVSFDLCPFVQRAAIVLNEKGVSFERVDIDLENKPDWFLKISPRGKVPVLQVGDDVLFESAAIVEYLDEAHGSRLHPADPISRARHRAWMEFGSAVLMDNWTLVTTHEQATFDAMVRALKEKLARIETELGSGPYFAGEKFTVVDAVFAPSFRYCDVFDQIAEGPEVARSAGRIPLGPRGRRSRLQRPPAPLHAEQGRRAGAAGQGGRVKRK